MGKGWLAGVVDGDDAKLAAEAFPPQHNVPKHTNRAARATRCEEINKFFRSL
jgi:hypothetical protein